DLASNEATFAPNKSGRRTTAISIPGRFTSQAKTALPVVFAFESNRGALFPINDQSRAVLSGAVFGTGKRIASPASSPSVARWSGVPSLTTLFSILILAAGTPHFAAAASANIVRAAAPTWRI